MKTPSEVLSQPEVNAVIEILLFHATPEVRQALMAHCPVAYVKLFPGTHVAAMAEVVKGFSIPPG